ncbi:MAG: extra-cytoplasmic solute receptor BugT [Noviherbaspirillum sp.]|nr:extra-cytoplasmic solute receptor BugT [Noviherbaspirillum sp.]
MNTRIVSKSVGRRAIAMVLRSTGLLLASVLTICSNAHAQDYPAKPIKIIVPVPAGDSSDRVARLLAEKFRLKWGQTVTVENRAGAGGNIGAEYVSKAPPDGYTLLFTPQFPLVVNKSLYTRLGYDPDSFTPVSKTVAGDMLLVVNPKVSASSVQQLISFAKGNPGRLNYASPGSGTMGHLLSETFKMKTGIKATHVPYKGASQALTDLLSGEVDMMFVAIGTALPYIHSGRIRAIGLASEKRSPVLPDVPTFAESIPDFVFNFWFGMVAPPGTPAAIAGTLSQTIADALKQPDVAAALSTLNMQPVGSTPAGMDKLMKVERERWSAIVHASGAVVE